METTAAYHLKVILTVALHQIEPTCRGKKKYTGQDVNPLRNVSLCGRFSNLSAAAAVIYVIRPI